jgi:hypothetical protein
MIDLCIEYEILLPSILYYCIILKNDTNVWITLNHYYYNNLNNIDLFNKKLNQIIIIEINYCCDPSSPYNLK